MDETKFFLKLYIAIYISIKKHKLMNIKYNIHFKT